jgi:putative transposase
VEKRSYRRDLPHIHPKGAAIFITFRLHGSLPPGIFRTARDAEGLSEGERFVRIDKQLDASKLGPLWLRNERIAEEVCRTIESGAENPLLQFTLHEYVVMPNHVHLFITPRCEMARITQGIKGSTARFGNIQLGRAGQPFWQAESYDHWCRNPEEFGEIRAYIVRNPVKAGLAKRPEDWRWSSIHRRAKLEAGAEMAQPATH